jgi:hypothetical protein
MYLPAVDDAAVFDDVVVRVLGGGETRVVGQDAKPISDFDVVKCVAVARFYFAVFLRQ